MARYFVGDEIHDVMQITDDGLLVDPDTVKFEYRVGRLGGIVEVTPTRDAQGIYTAIVPIAYGGVAYHMRWQTTNPTRAQRRSEYIERDVFAETAARDYPPVAQRP